MSTPPVQPVTPPTALDLAEAKNDIRDVVSGAVARLGGLADFDVDLLLAVDRYAALLMQQLAADLDQRAADADASNAASGLRRAAVAARARAEQLGGGAR